MSSDFSIGGPRVNAGTPVESLHDAATPSPAKARLVVEYNKALRDRAAVANLGKKAATLLQDIAGLKDRLKSLPPGSPEGKPLKAQLADKQSQMQATEMALVKALGGALNSPAANALRDTGNSLETLKGTIAGLEADLAATSKALGQLKASDQAETPPYAALELRRDLLQGQLNSARALEAPLANLRWAAIDTIQLQGQMLIAQQEILLLCDQPATPKEQIASATERLQGLKGRLDMATAGLSSLRAVLAQAHELAGELQDLADSLSSLDASEPGQGGADEGVAASEDAGASAQDD